MGVFKAIFLYLIPCFGFACSPVSPNVQKMKDAKYQTIFIGKITDRKIQRDSLGEIEKIQLKFLPLKVRKGEVSLDEYFWFPSSNADLEFVVGEYAYIYAGKHKKIAIDDWCYMLSGSLGRITPSKIDEMVLNWKLEQAIGSGIRAELIWAKRHIKKEIAELVNKKEQKYWVEQLEVIEKQLRQLY